MNCDVKFASVVIYVDDVASTVDFYRTAFGLVPSHYDESMGFAELGDNKQIAIASHAAGEFMMPEHYPMPQTSTRSGVEIAFWAEDVSAAFERAVKAGAKSITPPKEMSWGMTVAYVQSVEGTIIGFVSSDPANS